MDKISALLAEAKLLYWRRRRKRRLVASLLCSLVVGVWFGAMSLIPAQSMSTVQFEAYYAALYESDEYFSYNIVADETFPLNGYGLLEVV